MKHLYRVRNKAHKERWIVAVDEASARTIAHKIGHVRNPANCTKVEDQTNLYLNLNVQAGDYVESLLGILRGDAEGVAYKQLQSLTGAEFMLALSQGKLPKPRGNRGWVLETVA